MPIFRPSYRLRVMAPRSTDPAELTVLSPAPGAAHSDPFMVTTASGLVVPASSIPGAPPLVGPGGPWQNEPSGFSPLTDNDFSGVIPDTTAPYYDTPNYAGDGWGVVSNNSVPLTGVHRISDGGAPLSPPYAARFYYPIGWPASPGNAPGTLYFDTPSHPTKLFVGLRWKPSNPWQGHESGVNKVFFIWANAGGANVIYTWQMYGTAAPYITRMVSTGSGAYGWAVNENVGSTSPLGLDVYHTIEISLDLVTGFLKWWVDGVLITNIATGGATYGDNATASFPAGGVTQLQASPTWGGEGSIAKATNDYFDFDHIYASAA